MAIFLSLDEFQTFCELKSGGASYHPDEGVCNFSSLILVMSSSSDALLDHKADFLKFISKAQSFWFSLDTSYDHGCYLANRFRLDPEEYEALLIVAGVVYKIWLASKSRPRPACCHIASPRPLVAPPTHPLVAPAGCCVHHLSTRRPLVVSSSCRAASRFVSLRQLVVALSSLVILSLHCPPLVLSLCSARQQQGEAGRQAARRRLRAARR
jgi:hypothetical protein